MKINPKKFRDEVERATDGYVKVSPSGILLVQVEGGGSATWIKSALRAVAEVVESHDPAPTPAERVEALDRMTLARAIAGEADAVQAVREAVRS